MFEKAIPNPHEGEDITQKDQIVATDKPFDTQDMSFNQDIHEVDMETFAEKKPLQPETSYKLTSNGGYAQSVEKTQDLGEGIQIIGEDFQPQKPAQETRVQFDFSGGKTPEIAEQTSSQNLGGGIQILNNGVQLEQVTLDQDASLGGQPENNPNITPEEIQTLEDQIAEAGETQATLEQNLEKSVVPPFEVRSGAGQTETFTYKAQSPDTSLQTEQVPSPLTSPDQAQPESASRNPEGMGMDRELIEVIIAEKLGMFHKKMERSLLNISEWNKRLVEGVAKNPELSRFIILSSPEMLKELRVPQERLTQGLQDRYKNMREKGREFIKKIVEMPGKVIDGVVGMYRSTLEGIKNLASAPFQKAAGLLNRLVAGRNEARTKHFEAAEARKGELSPKQQEKLALAKEKSETARKLSDLIKNKA